MSLGLFGTKLSNQLMRRTSPHERTNSLRLVAAPVLAELQQVNDGLAEQLVGPHQSPVQDVDAQSGSVRAGGGVRLRQLERGLLLPHGRHTLLRHRRLVLVFAHLHERVRVVGAALALDAEAAGLQHRYLDAGGEPPLLLQHRGHHSADRSLPVSRSVCQVGYVEC